MRVLLRYDAEGHKVWSDSIPASPGSSRISGYLVIGASGPNDRDRRAEYQRRHVEKMRAKKA